MEHPDNLTDELRQIVERYSLSTRNNTHYAPAMQMVQRERHHTELMGALKQNAKPLEISDGAH